MEGNLWLMLLFHVVLIAIIAVFASAKAALVGISEGKLEKLSEEGDKRARKLRKLTKQPAKFIATVNVAIVFIGFLNAAFAAIGFSPAIAKWLVGFEMNLSQKLITVITAIIITLVISFFTLIFGEIVPTRVVMRNPEKTALTLYGFVSLIGIIFVPFSWLLMLISNCILRLFGIDPNKNENDVSEEDIRDMVDSAAKNSQIDDEEREFIQNVFEFDDLSAGDIATHRTDVTMLWLDESDEEWYNTIHERCHMFYPVCGESVDDVVGVLYLKDYFRLDDRARDAVMEKAVKKPYFIPETVKADVLFRKMKAGGKTFGIVLDEYGGMQGIITMNDLVTRLVGDLGGDDEETVRAAASLEKTADFTWTLRGNIPLDQIKEALGADIPADGFDTFSGMVFSEFGSIPADGEKFELDAWGLHISVSEVVDHQIEVAEITVTVVSEENADSDDVTEE